MRKNNLGSVATYVVIALILAVITYVEFAIVEYDIAWLSRGAVMFWLFFLSIIKFLLVIMFFMHLKGDDKTYTGFFSAGMIMALGTFIGLIFLFTVTSVSNYVFTNKSPEGVTEQVASASPPPADQSRSVTAPEAADDDDFAVGEEGTVEQTVASFDTAAAEAAYMANCSSCHQANGAGMPGVFPPFAEGHGAELYNADGGPEYLMHTVLFGLQGEIDVHGTSYNGAMPAWPQLSDEDLAGVLNHITTAWGNDAFVQDFDPFTADDLAERRGDGLSASDVHAAREALDLSDHSDEAPAEEAVAEEPAEEPAEEAAAEEPEEEPAEEAAPTADGEIDLAAGEAVYTANCVSCHQATGAGIPGAFPPLAGHVPDIYNADGGREVLLHTVLFGLQGEIEVDGTTYTGAMPGWPQFSDQEMADVLNYITHAWDNDADLEGFEAYEPAEVEEARDRGLSPQDVHEERQGLTLGAAAAGDADEADEADEADAEDSEEAEEAGDEAEEAEEAEDADAAEAEETAAAADFDREAAEAAYAANCASCHNSSGAGIPQVFPPLAGHLPDLYNADGGPEVIMEIMLYGMTGGIEVNGTNYSGAMPAWDNLDDDVLADAFNHIATAWGNEDELDDFTPATAADFEALRGQDLSTAEVHELRQALDLT